MENNQTKRTRVSLNFSVYQMRRTRDSFSTFGFSGAWRIGEASHPGPQDLTITSINVTSLLKRIGDLNSLVGDAQVCCVQEAGITPASMSFARKSANEVGWKTLLAVPSTSVANRQAPPCGRAYREGGRFASGGVASLARGVVVSPIIIPPQGSRDLAWDVLMQSGRWQGIVLSLPSTSVIIHNVYLPTRAKQECNIRESSEQLLRAVFMVAADSPNIPTIVCGDFNLGFQDSEVLRRVVETGAWNDGALSFSHLPDVDGKAHGPLPTHFPTSDLWVERKGGSRIDHILINSTAMRAVKDVWTHPQRVPGGHLPISVSLEVEDISGKLLNPFVSLLSRRIRRVS
jgi:exonuclease III